jgi:hypothetical protein
MLRHIALLFLLISPCLAADSDGQQLLDAAHKLVDIRSAGSKPFQLDADFMAQQPDGPQKGHLTLRWSARDLWQMDVNFGTFTLHEVFKGDTSYIVRSAPITPLRVSEMFNLTEIYTDKQNAWHAKKVRHRTEDGVDKDCLELHGKEKYPEHRELCINSATHDILSDHTKTGTTFHLKEFADYRAFGEHRYPWQMQSTENADVIVRLQVGSLQEASFESTFFLSPADAIVRRHLR